ncbi:MAG: MGMT family protein [Bacteroidales bacterium]|nr:MGMT family protein [Bacteroidales bacterium]
MTNKQDNNNFFTQVWELVKQIPYGRVTSYGAIAAYLGSKQSSRMVGWALNGSQMKNGIPAHRVVNRNGMLTGKSHFFTATAMEDLLRSEGVEVEDDKVKNFEELFWNPACLLEDKNDK